MRDLTWQTDNGSEFIGEFQPDGSRSHFPRVVTYFGSQHECIPPAAHTYQSDIETVHRLIEDEFYDLETFRDRAEFLAKASLYQLYFNLARPSSHKAGLTPWQIVHYAKGDEYAKFGINPEEAEAVSNYGGKVIFAPGDVVYSSSSIIESDPQRMAFDRLTALIKEEGLTFHQMRASVESFSGIKVHVLGDVIMDSYIYCSHLSGNVEAAAPCLKFERRVDFLGGAGIVAAHMKRAGAKVKLTTVLGDDEAKDFVLESLNDVGVECDAVIEGSRVTTQKTDVYRWRASFLACRNR